MRSPISTRKAELQELRAHHAAARLEYNHHADRGMEEVEPHHHWARPVHAQRCFAEALHKEQQQSVLATTLPGSSFEERLPPTPISSARRRLELPRAEAPILGFDSGPLHTSRAKVPSRELVRQQQRRDLEEAFEMLGGRLQVRQLDAVIGLDQADGRIEDSSHRLAQTAPAAMAWNESRELHPSTASGQAQDMDFRMGGDAQAQSTTWTSTGSPSLTPSIDGQMMGWARGLAKKSIEELEAEFPDLLEAARERSRPLQVPSLHSTAPTLAAANDGHWEVRVAVIRALSRLQLSVHLEALAVVCLALHDRSSAVRAEAQSAIRRQPRVLAEPLMRLVETSDIPKLRRGAAEGLSLLGLGASGAVEAGAQSSLVHALKDRHNREIRNTTARAFRETACPRNALASAQQRVEGAAPKAHEKPREALWSRGAAEAFNAPGVFEMPPYSWRSRISEHRARRKGWID
mmetsp:Transcript_3882/g.8867  ORF Transcript_3882/g.8867 Transcript_3882/m.8867 type:complete len:462 (+) Transcript_3882:282-1667(+)